MMASKTAARGYNTVMYKRMVLASSEMMAGMAAGVEFGDTRMGVLATNSYTHSDGRK